MVEQETAISECVITPEQAFDDQIFILGTEERFLREVIQGY